MNIKEKALGIAVKEAIRYVRKDYDKNLFKLIDWGISVVKDEAQLKALKGLKSRLSRPGNVWAEYVKKLICETDPEIIEKLIPPIKNTILKIRNIF